MAHLTVGAAAATGAIFLVLLVLCGLSFRLTRFRVFLLMGLSCAFRGVAYSLRASNVHSYSAAKSGSYLALSGAGYGISLAVVCLLLGCWWKNATAAEGRRRLAVGSRLLIAPVIALGPIAGCILAGLIYGDGSPGAMSTAEHMRKAVVWGMLSVLIVLLGISLFATFLAWKGQQALQSSQRAKGVPVTSDPDLLAVVMVGYCSLLLISASYRVAAAYHPNLTTNEAPFYSVQILPELLAVTLLLIPRLMPRAALGRRYYQWWEDTHGCAPPGEAALNLSHAASSKASSKVALDEEAGAV